MRRGRPKKIQASISPSKQIGIDIEERLAGCGRKEPENIIYVGELVERILKSEFGAILKALTAGRTASELQSNRDGKMSSERILGRIEMADSLWNDLEQFVIDKDYHLRPMDVQKNNLSTTEPFVKQVIEETFSYSP